MKFQLPGLVAAPFTPFRADGEIAFEVIGRQARTLAANGVIGAFVCGTTGEGASMTGEERRRVMEAWVAARPAGLKIIAHVGHTSAGEAGALARHAQEIGADAIATVAPSFFKPPGQPELVGWCAQVAAGAPKLPFFYYHIPSMTSVTLPAAAFLAEAKSKIPTLAGIKFTYEDLEDYQAARKLGGDDYQVLFGRDEILLTGLQAGATGAVGSTYNYAAPLYIRIMKAFAAGDLETAKREQAKSRAFIDIMNRFGGQPAGKAIMKLVGLDCGPVRLPMRALTAAQEAALRAELLAIGFFDYASKVAA
ncbi:MAG: dihydrodipicolinate synthase family protein [Verrucomicrobia bacterium]|nr:dihydrodipicolinate synthase family protein [Verrucomicrobiota bacterium]